jgi:hypothetical protein
MQLIKRNPPVPDAPSRIFMPQTGKAPGYDKKLGTGEINFKKPFVKEGFHIPSFDEYLNEIK